MTVVVEGVAPPPHPTLSPRPESPRNVPNLILRRTQGWVMVYEAIAADFDRALPYPGSERFSLLRDGCYVLHVF